MSIDATMAVLYAQTGLAAPMANAAAVAPQASLAMSRMLAAEMARQEQQQVEKSEKTDDRAINADDKGHGQPYFGNRRGKRALPVPPDDHGGDLRASASPLVGNLLNVKV